MIAQCSFKTTYMCYCSRHAQKILLNTQAHFTSYIRIFSQSRTTRSVMLFSHFSGSHNCTHGSPQKCSCGLHDMLSNTDLDLLSALHHGTRVVWLPHSFLHIQRDALLIFHWTLRTTFPRA